MFVKISLTVLLLIGSVESAWKSYQTDGPAGLAKYDSSMKGASSFSKKVQLFGFVNKVTLCSDGFFAGIEWQMGHICKPETILKKSAKAGKNINRFSDS